MKNDDPPLTLQPLSLPVSFTLPQVAAAMQFKDVRTLKNMLRRAGIAPIGTGRAARLEPADIELLKAKARTWDPSFQAPSTAVAIPASTSVRSLAATLRRSEARRLNKIEVRK